jgi:acetyl-CoA synthetase
MLGIMKVRAVIMPITTAVGPAELAMWSATRRTPAGSTGPGDYGRISVGEVDGWLDLREAHAMRCPLATHPGPPDDPLLLYSTSGTTSRPKVVERTQVSYPGGHLATMCWLPPPR